jgi:hypothetical protein
MSDDLIDIMDSWLICSACQSDYADGFDHCQYCEDDDDDAPCVCGP